MNKIINKKKIALISVYDKTNLVSFAKSLLQLEYTILSSGGTYTHLTEAFKEDSPLARNIIRIEDYTEMSEMLGGRVKTLHPKIHAGILARPTIATDKQDLTTHNIVPIEIVVVNLYPFEDTIKKTTHTISDAIEHIDIGGITLLRAAAKNHEHVLVLSDPADYEPSISLLSETNTHSSDTLLKYKTQLAVKTFMLTAHYEATIAQYMSSQYPPSKDSTITFSPSPSPSQTMTIPYRRKEVLRYGENPHQNATLYEQTWTPPPKHSLLGAKQISGKQLSFNNLRDAEAAIQIAQSVFIENKVICVGVKHGNPCGVAIADTVQAAWKSCYKADSISIFGGIVAISSKIDENTAKSLMSIFLEIIIAPKYSKEALSILKKKKNLRLLQMPLQVKERKKERIIPSQQYISITGGMLVQDYDIKEVTEKDISIVTQKKPTKKEIDALLFAWRVVKYVKSNAIVLVKGNRTIGIGAGQMNRVGAVHIALEQAKKSSNVKGAVLASDAFFPMSDSVALAAKYGVSAIIQPGGSIKDQESIDMCNTHNIAMVFTNIRHFLH